MKSRILGLVAVGLLVGPIAADAFEITIERISDTEALITGSGYLDGPIAPAANANLFLLLDPFAADPAPATRQAVFDSSTMTVGGTAVSAAQVVGTSFAPVPLLIFGNPVSDFAPFSAFAGSLHVNLGGSSTLLGIGSTGGVVWGNEPAGLWRIVARSAAPEPGTLMLLGLGLAGLGLVRRRRAS